MKLYHGSNDVIIEIKKQGLFGGLFASSDESAAMSHGGTLHVLPIDDAKILTQEAIESLDIDKVIEVIKLEIDAETEEELELAYRVIVEDKSVFDEDEAIAVKVFMADDLGYASWEGQRVRGVIANGLGFNAVEMDDEHGTTFLVLPGVAIEVVA